MSDRVLILKSETLERELAGILKDLRFVGQAIDLDIINVMQSSESYRSDILNQASASAVIEDYHRVVLFVDPPLFSNMGHESVLEMLPDDLNLLSHLTEPSWMNRLILIQRDNADAGDLWRVMNQHASHYKPKHIFGRPHGRDYDGKYVRQVAKATLDHAGDMKRGVLPSTTRLPELFKKDFAKPIVSASTIAAIIKFFYTLYNS